MHEKRQDPTIASTYRSSISDLMLTVGVVLLLVVPLAWPSLKGLFG